MGHVTVTFAGICAHFKDVVPGIPHRVVLPDAASFRFGTMRLPDGTEPAAYYVQPHFPIVQTTTDGHNPNVTNVMRDGYLFAGARLQVPNAVGPLTYDKSYFYTLRSLTDFVPQYRYSDEVVLGGRALCYFDVQSGTVSAETGKGGAVQVVIDIDTTGPPSLMLTPFEDGSIPVPLPLPDGDPLTILVANVEFGKASQTCEDIPFDFVLHYLTAQRGIPPTLAERTPGLLGNPQLNKDMLARALMTLADIIDPSCGPSPDQVGRFDADVLDPSCSDSRFP